MYWANKKVYVSWTVIFLNEGPGCFLHLHDIPSHFKLLRPDTTQVQGYSLKCIEQYCKIFRNKLSTCYEKLNIKFKFIRLSYSIQ